MTNPDGQFSKRDMQMICGLFLAMYDKLALTELGFDSFAEAFNGLGYALSSKPTTIKNYRDEFDPFFPNNRKGWHGRPLRAHCNRILKAYSKIGISAMASLINSFVAPEAELHQIPAVRTVLNKYTINDNSGFAKRLITGRAAEEYFVRHYEEFPGFRGQLLTDTTQWGCGFDFKLSRPQSNVFSAIEVKGLRGASGQIQLTDLEYEMALALSERYYLIVVKGFADKPSHTIFCNPVESDLRFRRIERSEVRVTWSTDIVRSVDAL